MASGMYIFSWIYKVHVIVHVKINLIFLYLHLRCNFNIYNMTRSPSLNNSTAPMFSRAWIFILMLKRNCVHNINFQFLIDFFVQQKRHRIARVPLRELKNYKSLQCIRKDIFFLKYIVFEYIVLIYDYIYSKDKSCIDLMHVGIKKLIPYKC